MEVGIRELRNHLSRYLDRVRGRAAKPIKTKGTVSDLVGEQRR